ncbi:MAG TPA: hypothetical protein VFA45_20720 [Actinomycetes bacterium]|jgi:hypothetical protein|nr:hypothetical protein [Actinomycetes bacterium]
MDQTQDDDVRFGLPSLPESSLTDPLDLLQPGLTRDVLRHPELTLGAKALAIYVLVQPRGRLFTRVEFERLSLDLSPALDSVLHELTRAGLLTPFPSGERPCCAPGFQLRED